MDRYILVPDEVVDEAIKYMAEEDNDFDNAYTRLKTAAEEFKVAGLSPMYVYDSSQNTMMVVVKELYGKKLH